jgi:4-hydroxy-2-oxoheptanedioate aldolase
MTSSAPNRLRTMLAAGEPVLGCWCLLADPVVAESLARAGFGCVVVDLQHGLAGPESVGALTEAVELGGAVPLVRVGWNDPLSIGRALDFGAEGVIVPMVSTATEARRAAAASRYPPDGERSHGPVRRKFASTAAANEDVLCLPMIETAEGLGNVAEIAATDGVDGLFVGPTDLALSLGLGQAPTDPAVLEASSRVLAAAAGQHRFTGTLAAGEDHAGELLRRGVEFVCLGTDRELLAGAAAERYSAVAARRAGGRS